SFIYGKDGNYDTKGLSDTVEKIRELQDNPEQAFHVWWNSVRVLSTIKALAEEASLRPILNRFKLEGLIVNNGKQMFVNNRFQEAAEWIIHLDKAEQSGKSEQNTAWKTHIEKDLGWTPKTVEESIRQALEESQFQPGTVITKDSPTTEAFRLPNDD